MKIAFEFPYYAFGVRGSSQYGQNLLPRLGAASPQDEFHAFTFFFRDYEKHLARVSKLASANVHIDALRWPQRLVRLAESSLGYPLLDRRYLAPGGFDLFQSGGTSPSPRIPTVIMIHGVPWDFAGGGRHFEEHMLGHALAARRLMFCSRCAMEFVLKTYPVDPKRCSVVYYGVDHTLFRPDRPTEELAAVRAKYSLPERFLLCVGPFQFRDNIELVLYSLSRSRGHNLLSGLKLVLAGGDEEHGPALRRRVRELGVQDLVVFAGHVPHADLAAFYDLAELYVHPSFYEELGAQLLEASASGAAVIAAHTGGIDEVMGDCALYFNPHQPDDFERALFRALESPALREDLGGRAHERSRRFDWDTAARQTLEVYRAALAG